VNLPRIIAFASAIVAVALVSVTWTTLAQQPGTTAAATTSAPVRVALPKPRAEGGMPLMEALKKRQSARAFADRKLSDQTLSDLLWAAWGVNRQDGRHTAPSAMNRQEIDVYVAKADGLWLFNPKTHDLTLVADKDLRALTGRQDFVKDAAVNLVFVADYSRMDRSLTETDKAFYGGADTGFISQNVYLFCASEGLATVVRHLIDQPVLAKAMGLRDNQRITLAQSVGYAPAGE
jgi:nitroreductase